MFLDWIYLLGEDLENESLHLHSTGLHCAALGGEIYSGITGLPLCPDHDSAIATLRAAPLLPRQGAQSGEQTAVLSLACNTGMRLGGFGSLKGWEIMGQQSLEGLCSIAVSGWMASLGLVALGVQYEMDGQPGARKQVPIRQRPVIRVSSSIFQQSSRKSEPMAVGTSACNHSARVLAALQELAAPLLLSTS